MSYIEKLRSLQVDIGQTPLIKITYKYNDEIKCMYAKEEWLNPSGSIKIRSAYQIIFDAVLTKQLKEGQEIVEVSSGNMGIALAYIGNVIGNPVTILIPKTMSKERIELIKRYKGNVILTSDFNEAFKLQQEMLSSGAFSPNQFNNFSNVKAHLETTGKEIGDALGFAPAFISGVGTGGTLTGAGGYLKDKFKAKIIAIDPDESRILTTGTSQGKHLIQGLSDGIIPSLYIKKIVDQIINIKSIDAISMARKLAKVLNLHVGISSGANFLGCVLSGIDKATTVFADGDDRYLSLDVFNNPSNSNLIDKIELISYEIVK